MTERIDHAAAARVWVEGAERPDLRMDETQAFAAVAQVHATLSLVEQQRIANLIALQRHEVEHDVNLSGSRLYLNDGTESLKSEIAEVLGL